MREPLPAASPTRGAPADPPANLSSAFSELPPSARAVQLSRDLGYLEQEQQKQLEGLIEVQRELDQLPIDCFVCRVAAMEGFAAAVQLGLESGDQLQSEGDAEMRLGTTLRRLCTRIRGLQVLGIMDRRMRALRGRCKELWAQPSRLSRLSALSGALAVSAAGMSLASTRDGPPVQGVGPSVDELCAEVCPAEQPCGSGLDGWAAVLEVVLGREPLGAALLANSSRAFPDMMANSLLFFAAAKSDVHVLRVMMAISPASPSTLQCHGAHAACLQGLGAPLAALMTAPSIKQQLQLLKAIMPHVFQQPTGATDIEAFLRITRARLTVRIDDEGGGAVNDTALHVAAYGYDHEGILSLLLRDGGNMIDTADSHGRTALHYAADAQDQVAALVNVFAEPPAGTTPVSAQRTVPAVRMAADHLQSEVVSALSAAQLATVRLLLAYGADPNAQATLSGSTPLHLAARSGATAVVELLVQHAGRSALESRNRHGWTPLMLAASLGHAHTCRVLLRLGARADARNAMGRDASWYAGAAASAMGPKDAQALFGPIQRPLPRILLARRSNATESDLHSSISGAGVNLSASVSGGWGAHDETDTTTNSGGFAAMFGLTDSDMESSPRDGGDGLSDLLGLCDVDVRSKSLDPAVFESDYLLASRPVLIQGAADEIPARRLGGGGWNWQRAEFFARVGQEVFNVQKLPMWKGKLLREQSTAAGIAMEGGEDDITLAEYFDSYARHRYKRPLSWNGPRNQSLWSEMEHDLTWPAAVSAPTVRRPGSGDGYFGLFMGPQGSGVTMHHHKSAWNALLFGLKLWVLTPPHASAFRRDEMAADSFSSEGHGWLRAALARAQREPGVHKASGVHSSEEENGTGRRHLFCVQREGDVLFVPHGWGHSTLNLRESIGVANFFLDEDAVGYRPSKIFHSNRGIRSLQTALGVTAPSDFDPDGHP
eukprot:COSAG02_NODE_91_length_37690_cov_91.664840_9_plen_943_part_00